MSEVLSQDEFEMTVDAIVESDAGTVCDGYFKSLVDHDKAQREIIAALQRRVDELERLSSQVYQVVGSLASDADLFGNTATTKVLDNLSMASCGKPLPHAELLPFPAAGRVEWTNNDKKQFELAVLGRARRALSESFFGYDIKWWMDTPKKEVYRKACEENIKLIDELLRQVKAEPVIPPPHEARG